MTKKKSRKRRPTTYRAPAPIAAPAPSAPRPGILASLFTPRVSGTTGMPRLYTSFGRGFVTVAASPPLVLGAIVFPFFVWLVLISVGFQGPATVLANLLALPPIGTTFDYSLSISLFGAANGPVGILILAAFFAVRSAVIGIVFGLVVEMLQTGKATLSGVVRGLWVTPVVFAVTFIGFGLLILGQVAGAVLGLSLAFFVIIASVIASIYLFVFAPLCALTQGTGIGESIKTSVRAARMPGAGNLGVASVYGIVAIAISSVPGVGATIGLDPATATWVYISLIGVFHVSVMATFAYRWMCIEDEIPEPPVRQAAPPVKRVARSPRTER
jgi:hypothetical protein